MALHFAFANMDGCFLVCSMFNDHVGLDVFLGLFNV